MRAASRQFATAIAMAALFAAAPAQAQEPAPAPPIAPLIEPAPSAPGTPGQRPQFGPGAAFAEPELLLMALRLRDITLADDLLALLEGTVLMLPLGELARALEFRISVDPAAGRASGWFIRENRLFSLDLRRGTVVVEGRESTFERRDARVVENDIFVDIRLLAQWFPVDLRYDVSELLVTVEPRELLPVDERLKREAYRYRALQRRVEREALERIELPYRALSAPTVDVATETAFNRRRGGTHASGSYNVLATSDLLWMNSEIYLSGNQSDTVNEARIRLERKDPDGGLLGGMNATEVGFGDINTPQVPLVANLQMGRGAIVSNMPLDAPDEFDRITLEGNLPLGWEVELYRNGVLLEFQSASADGLYRIADVPLLYGVNVLRLVFYGPQGQRREEIRQVRVGADQLRPGDVRYRIAAAQHDERVFSDLRAGTPGRRQGEDRMMGSVMAGATDWLTVGASFASVPTLQGQRDYAGTTAVITTGSLLWRADAVRDSEGGTAARLSAQTSLYGYSLLGEHNVFDRFRSESVGLSDSEFLESRTRLRTEGIIDLPGAIQLPLSLTLDWDRFEGDRRDLRLSNRLSFAVDRTSVSNTLSWTETRSAGTTGRNATGNLLVGGSLWDFRLRGQVNYQVTPAQEVSAVSTTVERALSPRTLARGGVQRSFTGTGATVYNAGINVRHDLAYIGFRAEYDDGRREALGLMTLSFSFGPDPARGSAWMAGERAAGSGNFAGRVFLDSDGDGRFDPEAGDRPLPGARLTVDGRARGAAANEDGLVLLRGLPAHREAAIGVDPASLNDPFLVARERGIAVVPRPGTAPVHDFAVTTTGEIDGTVFRVIGESATAVAGAIVQLLDAEGAVVREVRSAYDGFFLFDFVRPGAYRLRIAPDQAEALGIRLQQERAVAIKGDGTIASGQDLVLVPAR